MLSEALPVSAGAGASPATVHTAFHAELGRDTPDTPGASSSSGAIPAPGAPSCSATHAAADSRQALRAHQAQRLTGGASSSARVVNEPTARRSSLQRPSVQRSNALQLVVVNRERQCATAPRAMR